MTRLAAGGRAAQPGLACAWWFRSRARENRKARIQAAAHHVAVELAVVDAAALGSVTKLTIRRAVLNTLSGSHSRAEMA